MKAQTPATTSRVAELLINSGGGMFGLFGALPRAAIKKTRMAPDTGKAAT